MSHFVCTNSGRCIECEKEKIMYDPTKHCACDCHPKPVETQFVLCPPCDEDHGDRPTPSPSPWVRRNEDYAQYPQPRGSQYEGSDW